MSLNNKKLVISMVMAIIFISIVSFIFWTYYSSKPLIINIVQTKSNDSELPGFSNNIINKITEAGYEQGRAFVYSYSHVPEDDDNAAKALMDQAVSDSPNFLIALGKTAGQYAKEAADNKNDLFIVLYVPKEQKIEYIFPNGDTSVVEGIVNQSDLEARVFKPIWLRLQND